MTQPQGPDRSGSAQLRRYGPLVAIVLVIAVVAVAVLAGGGGDDGSETSTGTGGPEVSEVGAPEPVGEMPLTYDEAVEEGTEDDYDWGDRCDTDRGTVEIPSVYALPCVPVFEGDNGGATYRGVTADSIKIVRYRPAEQADMQAMFASAGVDDTREETAQTILDYFEIFASRAELYGRTLDVEIYDGTGGFDDEVASKADAVQIAEELEPFAVVGGPVLDGGVFASELASRDIVCIACGTALPDAAIQEYAPFLWGTQPSPEQFLLLLRRWLEAADAEAVATGDDSATSNAVYAGPELRDRPRKTAVVHLEQDPPVFEELESEQTDEFDQEVEFSETYLLDLTTMPDRAKQIVARLKDEEITTVVFIGDLLMPTYLTREATEQEYYPEWLNVGPGLWDTDTMARTYDQDQWEHAWGLSFLAVPVPETQTEAWTLYEWYFGEGAEPPAKGTYQLLAPPPAALIRGLHMAGPDLNPDTFARGMFRVPPAGGGPTNPQVSYGNWGYFPDPDYFAIDDAVGLWWDRDATGEDRIGQEGTGLYAYSAEGTRINTEDTAAVEPFDPETSVFRFDEQPAEDRPPDYPPPPGSPAASG